MNDFIDDASRALEHRARPQVANHVRAVANQQLDALLRIEELLAELVAAGRATRVHDEVQITADDAEDLLKTVKAGGVTNTTKPRRK